MKTFVILAVVIGCAIAQQRHCNDRDDCRRIGHLCHSLHEDVVCNNGQCQCVPHSSASPQHGCQSDSDCSRLSHLCQNLHEAVKCSTDHHCQCVPRN